MTSVTFLMPGARLESQRGCWSHAAGEVLVADLRPWSSLMRFCHCTSRVVICSPPSAISPNVCCWSVTLGCILANSRGPDPRTRLFWRLLSLGCALWLVAQGLWTYFEVVLRQEVPNPFIGDVILILHLVPFMGALAVQPHVERDGQTIQLGALDFALVGDLVAVSVSLRGDPVAVCAGPTRRYTATASTWCFFWSISSLSSVRGRSGCAAQEAGESFTRRCSWQDWCICWLRSPPAWRSTSGSITPGACTTRR